MHAGEDLPGQMDPAMAAKHAEGDHETAPEVPSTLSPEEDPTSPLYDSPHSQPLPKFCKMQLCAPYPEFWIHGKLRDKLYEKNILEQCPVMEPLEDMHPHEPYDGTLEKPEVNFMNQRAVAKKPPAHPLLLAREKAMSRRRLSWEGAMRRVPRAQRSP